MSRFKKPPLEIFLLLALAAVALAVRWVSRHEYTRDMEIYIEWYTALDRAGGFRALGEEIGNYNAPVLYMFWILTFLPGAAWAKIKLLWFVFDVVLVFFTYKIVGLKHEGWRVPALAAAVMALLPTVVANSAVWGQCDALLASLALGGVYFLLKGRDWAGVAMISLAFAVKPQAIFILPLLGFAVLLGRARWRTLLLVPALYLLLDVPAFIAGRDVVELLTIYFPARTSGVTEDLTSKAASLYAFLPVGSRVDTVRALGQAFAAALVIGVLYAALGAARRTRRKPDNTEILLAAAFLTALVPWVLPGMHERYFFLADVLTLVLVFYLPRLWILPLLSQVASLTGYIRYLFPGPPVGYGRAFIPLPVAAVLMLAVILALGYTLATRLLVVDAEGRESLLKLVGFDKNLTRLGPLGGADDAAGLHEVHEPARLRETDPELALEHGRGAELGRDDELDGLKQ
jgi:Gpi18-like mannosyltransferase